VKLGSIKLRNWTNTAVPLTNISWMTPSDDAESAVFHTGTFSISGTPSDTFLRVDGWTKVGIVIL
jgi:hypothetical protein